MRYRVRVRLEPTDEVRATLAAVKISIEGSTAPAPGPAGPLGTGEAFIALVEADSNDDAEGAVREAVERWGDTRVEALGPA
jgi:hypothetical protein